MGKLVDSCPRQQSTMLIVAQLAEKGNFDAAAHIRLCILARDRPHKERSGLKRSALESERP